MSSQFPADLANFVCANAESAGVPFRTLGTVGGETLKIDALVNVEVTRLVAAHESCSPPLWRDQQEVSLRIR